uniref:Zgc:112980 n=1 Tax=Sinocyclocheilus grahami TaxID=75366 RepID=A0A672MDL3_SINGR
MFCRTEHDIPIIILSDDDDDEEGDFWMTHNDSSVLIVENERNEADVSKHIEELDEDLIITYTQTATVLPHARYDCTLAFCRAEQDVSGPLQDNGKHCDQCFCYICDKLASMVRSLSSNLNQTLISNKRKEGITLLMIELLLVLIISLFVMNTTKGFLHLLIFSYFKEQVIWVFEKYIFLQFSFYQKLPLPSNCTLPKILSVLPWDDPLLSAVMKGQNITGERQGKGRKHKVLCEPLVVIQARVCKLQQQNKYRELARYLKVVKSINNPMLQRMKDLVPLYLCKDGDYTGAVCHMLSPMPGAMCLASRLAPQQFRSYLRILTSGHAPDVTQEFDTRNGHMVIPDPLRSTKWSPIEGSNSFKMMEVLKFALRVLDCNSIVFADPETWVYLLSVVSSSFTTPDGVPVGAFYAEPDVTYQTGTRDAASAILEELTMTSRIQIPKTFESGYPDQARLLLATQALVLRIFHSQLRPILNVIISFRFNRWALRWFFYSLLVRPEVLHYLLCCLLEELSNERYQLLQRKWTETEHSLVAYFLCMYFWENSIVLDLNTYPTNSLLATWNESHNPWQLSLKLYLECNVRIFSH